MLYDRTLYLSMVGAYGTGKTTLAAYKLILTYMSVPNVDSVVMANTIPQLTATIYKDIKKFLPLKVVDGGKLPKLSKSAGKFSLTKGHNILLFASGNENDLR